jgi:hypothetical protein
MLYQLLGAVIILAASVDIFLTVLYPRTGKSVISIKICRGTWELFRQLSRLPIKGSKRILSYCGPSLVIIIVTTWVLAFTLGFALLVWPTLGVGIQASQGETPTDFLTALYYSGFTITTLGVGDLVPKTGFWRLVTVLEAAVGFSVITASLAYLLSVYNALTQRNSFALSLYYRSAGQADAASLLARMKGYNKFEPAVSEIAGIGRNLLMLLELHHAYPILHFFRFREAHYALARMALICLDLSTLIKTALHPDVYGPFIGSSAVAELESSGFDLLFQLSSSFLGKHQLKQPSFQKEWRDRYFEAVELLQNVTVPGI